MSVFDKDTSEELAMEYMGDVDAAMHRRGHPWAFTITVTIVLFFVCAAIWAANAMIDDVTRGNGQVIPAQGVQPIQSERGGTINTVLVRESEFVERNQPLLTISNVQMAAGLKDLQTRNTELEMMLKRLDAEEWGRQLRYTEDEERYYPEAVSAQMQIYATRKLQYEGQREMLSAQTSQRKNEVQEARKRQQSYREAHVLLKKKESTYKPLVGRSVTQFDFLALQQEIITLEGELGSVEQTIARAEGGVRAAEERLRNIEAERMATIADESNKSRIEQASIQQQIRAGDDQVTRAELRSPVRGTVKRILLKQGGVAKPAETIMEILPTDGTLEIEAKFSPTDRGFLFVNQEAMVKVTAYEFSIYGGLEATVVKISQDTIEDKKGEPWYEVRLLTKRKSLLYRGEELPILPGMTVSVDVLTAKKSILSKILAPIRDAAENAMTEH